MLSRQLKFAQNVFRATDALLVLASIYLTYETAESIGRFCGVNDPSSNSFFNLSNLAILVIACLASLEAFGLYRPHRFLTKPSSAAAGFIVLGLAALFFGYAAFAKILLSAGLSLCLCLFVLFLEFSIWLRINISDAIVMGPGSCLGLANRALICGAPVDRAAWRSCSGRESEILLQIKDHIDLTEDGLSRFLYLLHRDSIDVVVFCLGHTSVSTLVPALRACTEEGIETWIWGNMFPKMVLPSDLTTVGEESYLVYRTTPET